MEMQTLFNVILGLLMAGLTMMGQRFWKIVDNLRHTDEKANERITQLSITVASEYVKHDQLEIQVDRILDKLDKLEQRILEK
nr:lysis cassettes protein family protein [uncultured Gammaproteobacteria bacterium]